VKKSVAILGIVGLCVLAINVCGIIAPVSAQAQTPKPGAASTPRYGGVLIIGGQEAVSLGYPAAMTGTTDGQQSSVCLESLFRFDEKAELVPLLATSWKADARAKTITLTLRKGVKFHDGTDFNAKACKWNLDAFRDAKRPELKNVASVEVVDDYTVRLDLTKFDNVILSHLATDPGRMISPAAFQKNGQAWCEKNPVGTGPFQFASWQRDVAIKFKRFDGYWDGKPYLDGIEFRKVTDLVASIMVFKSGGMHIISAGPKDTKALEKEGIYTIVVPPEGQVTALAPNSKDPKSPFADIRVRQAFSYAIDSAALTEAFGYGYWKVMNQWAIPGSAAYNPAVVGYPYNPKKAKELLAAAGYPNGFKTTLHFYNLSPSYVDEMTVLQSQLKEVGIEAAQDGLQRPKYSEMASQGKGWTGVVRTQGASKPDWLAYLAQIAGGTEYSEIDRPQEFVDSYAKATSAPDFATKKKFAQELMTLAADKYCLVTYLFLQPTPFAKSKKVHDDLYGVLPNRYISPKAWLSD
jgi:peptide/nickel transport system substrate-binding protein